MSKKILRLLVVDDSPDDADAIGKGLRAARFMLKSQRVSDANGLKAALAKGKWDMLLCEYALPNFGAAMVLDILRRDHAHLPVIVYTHHIDEEPLQQIMRAGAKDVVLKARPARLIPAIERELAVAIERKQFQRTSEAMKEAEDKHRAVVESAREAICYCHDGMHIEVNPAYLTLFAYEDLDELEGIPVLNLIDREQHTQFKDLLKRINKNRDNSETHDFQAIKKDGSRFDVEITLSPVNIKGEDCIQLRVVDITKRKAAENRLLYLSQRDPLTGLYNRHHFQQLLNNTIEKTKLDNSHSTLIYIDLFDLQRINTSLGYTAGDRMLLKVSKLFHDHLDNKANNGTAEQAVLARVGGLEFAILLPQQDQIEAGKLAETLKQQLKASPLCERGKTYHCECVGSVVEINSNSISAKDILSQAQAACEQRRTQVEDKPAHKNTATESATAAEANAELAIAATEPAVSDNKAADSTIEYTTEEPVSEPTSATTPNNTAADTGQSAIEQEAQYLRSALEANAFKLAYQPIINLHGNPGEYYEVLLRMLDTDGKTLLPRDFIPTAERAGLMPAIDKWVIQHALESQAIMSKEGRQGTFFINFSAASCADDSIVGFIAKLIKQYRLDAKHIVIELDEPVVAQHPQAATTMITKLHELGCHIALDNYGKEFDTLLNLPRKSVRFLKLDASIINNARTEEDFEALEALMEITRKLEIKTIAKCIEDANSLSNLWRHGIGYVQGNYFQQAESDLNYDFAAEDETTLSSDSISSSWSA